MLSVDENALMCDFAEVYHIYDIYDLPPSKTAVLALGLRDDSRIKMAMSDIKLTTSEYLLAMAVDALNAILWTKTKDAEKGRHYPKSILNALSGVQEKKSNDNMSFDSPEEFIAYRERLINNEKKGG